jgi:hypothetical protein
MKFFRPLDAVLVAGVMALAVWSFWGLGLSRGSRAVVFIANHKYGWYDIEAAPREVALPTAIGPVRVRFGGGEARIVDSPCPNKLCVKHGAIRRGHDEVICLPARLLIVLEGDASSSDAPAGGVDAVTR